jgi:quercetin dioxygenase-like cupin family protein
VEAAAKHIHVRAKSGPAYWTVGCMFRFLVSSADAGGSYTTMEITVPPGEGANPHSHSAEEEQFYVCEGDVTFEVAGDQFIVGPGDFVHIRPEISGEVPNLLGHGCLGVGHAHHRQDVCNTRVASLLADHRTVTSPRRGFDRAFDLTAQGVLANAGPGRGSNGVCRLSSAPHTKTPSAWPTHVR